MTKENLKPYDWIKRIPASLAALDEIPLTGNPPDFPWDKFSEKLSKTFEIQGLTIEPSPFEWRDPSELMSGLGNPLPLNFSVVPFDGTFYWAMAKEDIKDLMKTILFKEGNPTEILEQEYLEGFYYFLALEVIHIIETLDLSSEFAPKIIENASLPQSPMLCRDVTIKIQGKTAKGRIFLSPELRKSMAAYYSREAKEAPLRSPLSEKLEVTLHLEAGSITFTQKEWSKVKPGDFLILDNCTLSPKASKGNVMITLSGHPFYKGEIKDGKIKILEHPLYHEVK